jgi:DNA-binding CsgD family transcriptional regulator
MTPKKEKEILKWHYAGKKHSWIADKFGVSKKDIEELILKVGK